MTLNSLSGQIEKSSYLDITKELKNKESVFYVLGWIAVAFFFAWGNTSLGFLFLLIHHIYLLVKGNRIINLDLIINNYDKKFFILINMLLSWALFTSFFAKNKPVAFLSTFGFTLIFYIFLFGIYRLINYKKFIFKVLIPLTVVSISISSVYTIYNYFVLEARRSTTIFANINDSGSIFIVCTGLLLGYLGFYQHKRKYLLLIPLVSTLTALFLTFSRGAMVGVSVGVIVFILISLKNRENGKNIVVMLVLLMVLGSFILSYVPLRERVGSIFSIESNMSRIIILQGTVNMIQDNFILGAGAGNFPFVYSDYKVEAESRSERPYSHNIFFNMFAELGIIGGLLYLAIIAHLFKAGYVIAKLNPLNRGLFAGFSGVMVHEQFDCITLALETSIIFWILAGFIGVLYYKNFISGPD